MPPSPPAPSNSPSSLVASQSLSERLSSVLPKDRSFGIYHLSTPPQKTDALFSALPNKRPDRTFCEKHFFAVSIRLPSKEQQPLSEKTTTTPVEKPATTTKREVLVLGLEIFLYTTAHSSTLFVSKADSTGYLPLLGLPHGGTASPIRDLCAAFIEYLVEHRRRAGIQFVISLFARSQGQYLFPGSIEHGGKHVLGDRGLIKWWCRALDPLIGSPPPGEDATREKIKTKGYLLVPGLDAYETRALIPHGRTSSTWVVAHPLERISRHCRELDWVPPRCLIPRFPDDPKCRFRDELDEETGSRVMSHTKGSWKSVKTLDMFWEMMAYRQECSSGRMTGFIWVVLDQEADGHDDADAANTTTTDRRVRKTASPANTTPPTDFPRADHRTANSKRKTKSNPKLRKPKKLKGPIKPRQPKGKTQPRNHHLSIPAETPYYHWPTAGRGTRIINEATYKRITELMLHSDFSNLDKAVASTERWIREGGIGDGNWGRLVTGQRKEVSAEESGGSVGSGAAAAVNDLGGLVKRKRNMPGDETEKTLEKGRVSADHKDRTDVNVLNAQLVRKKPKTS